MSVTSRRARYKIARGALRKLGRIVALYVGLTVALVAAALGFLTQRAGAGAVLGPKALAAVIGGVLLATLVGLLVFVNLPGWLEIGSDGLGIDWRGDYQYVPFSEIDEASAYRESSGGKTFVGVDLLLRGAEHVRVLIGEDQFGAGARAAKLREAISAALAAFRARAPSEQVAIPERGESSAREWLARLKAAGSEAQASPRQAAIPPDRLWRIVEDPAALPETRASAAAALTGALDEEGKDRLRIAAAETASPKLRIVLERAASADEGALADALERVQTKRS